MCEIIINEARQDDIAEIRQLLSTQEMDGQEVLSEIELNRIFDLVKKNPQHTIFVARQKGQVVGFFTVIIAQHLSHRGGRTGIINDVIVDSSCRKKGIGSKMMDYAANYCKKNGCYKIELSSGTAREGAHKFYEKLGYTVHGKSFLLDL